MNFQPSLMRFVDIANVSVRLESLENFPKRFKCVSNKIICCLNFWDEAWWFLWLRVFGLLSSSILLFPQHFSRYVLRPSSGVYRTSSKSGLGSNGNEGIHNTPHSSRSRASPPDAAWCPTQNTSLTVYSGYGQHILNPTDRMCYGQDLTLGQIFSGVVLVWIQASPSPRLVAVIWPNNLLIAGEERRVKFMTFLRALTQSEIQAASSRIWNRVTVSISYDNNRYVTSWSRTSVYRHL